MTNEMFQEVKNSCNLVKIIVSGGEFKNFAFVSC